jgi:16S rRNA (guanine527-N7)-methyltransferase
VGDVLPLAPRLEGGLLLDVGSGNGSPGLVLALLRPEIPVRLLEPRTRRWAFLKEAVRTLDRPDIQVLKSRHDAYAGPPARSLTLRALALPLAELLPLLEEGGRVYVFGRPPGRATPFVEEERAGRVHVYRRERST